MAPDAHGQAQFYRKPDTIILVAMGHHEDGLDFSYQEVEHGANIVDIDPNLVSAIGLPWDCGCDWCREILQRIVSQTMMPIDWSRFKMEVEPERLKEALEMIAGIRPCPDNLLSNSDLARIALKELGKPA